MRTPSLIKKFFQRKNNRGIAVIYIALLLVVLLAFAGLAIDIGYMYVAKTQLQNAADAAALAGASRLNVTESYVFAAYTSAITEAKKFAGLNNAAKESVTVSSTLTSSVSSNVYVEGNPGNDITFGNWDGERDPAYIKAGDTGGTPVNAIQVRSRRTAGSPRGAVSVFFGKLFGWDKMPVSAIATATPVGFGTGGLSICTETCSVSIPNGGAINLYINNNSMNTTSIAWTTLSPDQDSTKAPNVKKMIRGELPVPTNFCSPSLCVATDNGTQSIDDLKEAFEDNKFDIGHKVIDSRTNKVTKWTVVVPVLEDSEVCYHSAGSGCPPYRQGGGHEPYHVKQIALLDIVDVISRGGGNEKGILVSRIECLGCIAPPIRMPNQAGKLVKDK